TQVRRTIPHTAVVGERMEQPLARLIEVMRSASAMACHLAEHRDTKTFDVAPIADQAPATLCR
ncbi:MAG TPA: hypothetical protein VFP34_06355, partial [Microlunatus sp.]|nr:hypothetical protein [Microlunatus sp.]